MSLIQSALHGLPDETQRAFLHYHKANPQVWQAFERYALEAAKSGKKKYGAKSIMERVRWEFEIE